MRTNLILSIFGILLGSAALGMVYLIAPGIFSHNAGNSFESVDDLRRAMTERDSRDDLPGGEVSLRSIVQPNLSDSIIYELTPNLTAQFRHVKVIMNSFGMRSPEITLAKPPNTVRIAVLGDSYAFGWGVEQDKPFSRVMEAELNRAAPTGRRVEVLNFGVPGYATFQEVGQFFEKGVKFNPDAVLVYFINNDFGLPFFIRDLENSESLKSAPDFDRMHVNPEDEEKVLKRKKLLESLDANRALLQLAIYGKEHGIKIYLALHPDQYEQKMLKRLWVLKNSPGKELISLLPLTPGYEAAVAAKDVSEESLKIPHDHHPGPGAHQIIGKLLANQVAADLFATNSSK